MISRALNSIAIAPQESGALRRALLHAINSGAPAEDIATYNAILTRMDESLAATVPSDRAAGSQSDGVTTRVSVCFGDRGIDVRCDNPDVRVMVLQIDYFADRSNPDAIAKHRALPALARSSWAHITSDFARIL